MQLYELSEFSNVTAKLTDYQLEEIAKCITTTYGYLKTTELMYFFHLFKCGKFGRFYGSVDGLVITQALQDFLKLRANELSRYEQEQRDEARAAEDAERQSSAMNLEEWRELAWLFNMGYEPWRIAEECES